MSKRIRFFTHTALALSALVLGAASCSNTPKEEGTAAIAAADTVATAERGAYLAATMSCHDCHTPGAIYGAPDFQRAFSGSEVGWGGPWGVSYARNLTPDPETGLGSWTEDQIVLTLQTGTRPNGTALLPPMPWPNVALLTHRDIHSLAKYLKSIVPVKHTVPAAVPPGGRVTTPVTMFAAPGAWDAPRTPAAATKP